MGDDLPILMALRVQGIASPERVSSATGIALDDAVESLQHLVDGSHATQRSGRVAGYTLTASGTSRLDDLLEAEGLRTDGNVAECYDKFLQLNPRVIKLCSDWQVRREGGVETPNDHSDPHYDEAVVDRLVELHERTRKCMLMLSDHAPRFGPYLERLDSCVERLRRSERAAFTAPLAESYHTVWFELHQDLLLTLGLQREE